MITIDLFYLMEMILPPLIRQQFAIAYMTAVFSPLNTLQTAFYDFYSEKKYELTWNGQVIMLEHLLNDQFDNIDRGIYIDDAGQTALQYWFTNSESNEDTFIFTNSEAEDPYYLFTTSEYEADVDFTVYVPSAVTFDENLMRFYINKYRCAGKRFNIEII